MINKNVIKWQIFFECQICSNVINFFFLVFIHAIRGTLSFCFSRLFHCLSFEKCNIPNSVHTTLNAYGNRSRHHNLRSKKIFPMIFFLLHSVGINIFILLFVQLFGERVRIKVKSSALNSKLNLTQLLLTYVCSSVI